MAGSPRSFSFGRYRPFLCSTPRESCATRSLVPPIRLHWKQRLSRSHAAAKFAFRPRKRMKPLWNIFLMGVMSLTVNAHAGEPTPLRLVQTIPLPNVEGRIDHLAVDLKGERLFVAALGNNTVEVLDLRAGKRLRSITGLHEPQGVGFIPEFNKIYVANAKSGTCDVFDASSFKVIKSAKFSDDADNIRYDPAT